MAIRYEVTPRKGALHGFLDRQWEKVERALHGKHYDDFKWDCKRQHIIARDGQKPVGYAGLYIDGGVVVLDELIVHDHYRGRGIGRRLLENTEALARRLDAHKITLETDDGLKAAIKLYTSCGFRKEATLPRHYGKRPTTIYGKQLDV